MTFEEVKQVVEQTMKEHPEIKLEDVAHMFIDQQQELQLPDLDLGIILVLIGAEDFLTENAIKALEQEGLMDKDSTETETETETKTETETDKGNSEEESEKEEVRNLYSGK